MRTLGLALGALLVTLALAGCSDDGGSGGEGDGDSDTGVPITYGSTSSSTSRSSSGPASSSSSSSSAPAGNRPPTASITAAVNGTNATLSLSGSDPDGDALAWELDFGDGNETAGTTLPATVGHAYRAGNFTARLSVTDGKASAAADVVVRVVGRAAGFVFTGDVEQDCATTCAFGTPAGSPPVPPPGAGGCIAFATDMPGLDCIWTELAAGLAGKAFTLASTAGDPDAEFFDACDPAMGASVGQSFNAGPESGTVPDGAGCAILWEYNAGPSTLTLTIG